MTRNEAKWNVFKRYISSLLFETMSSEDTPTVASFRMLGNGWDERGRHVLDKTKLVKFGDGHKQGKQER
ncbi:hypothetical protein CTI12_AA460120 [Artemisia annua]|uniref:Uncharacterized protein n=1 Tax=Artemisia annua TaxID=35608 RepID=A0A2U1LRX5_ARTAN|nr:hypothetical protein CTI12_AA460120 [Artemisia annua]